MKHITTFLVLLIAATAVSEELAITDQQKTAMARAAEFHTFTTVTGKEIVGRLVDFAKETETVMFETSTGAEQPIALSTLSEKDQAFIQDWLTGHSLFSDNKIRFTIRKKTDPDKESKGDRSRWHSMFPNMKYKDHWHPAKGENSYDEIFYELRLENKSGKTLKDLTLEYCIYHPSVIKEKVMKAIYTETASPYHLKPDDRYIGYEPHWVGYEGNKRLPKKTVSNTIQKTVRFENIAKGTRSTKQTEALNLVGKSEERANYYTASPKVGDRGTRNTRTIEGKILGIRCRVYVPTQDGNYAMVEFSNPSSLKSKTEWIAP